MRGALALLAFLLLALPTPSLAQEAAPLLEDPQGDVRADTAQGGSPVPGFPAVDLVGLAVAETPEAVTFTLRVADLTPPDQDPHADGSIWTVGFTHNGRQFQATVTSLFPILIGDGRASLRFRDSDQAEWDLLWRGQASLDLAANAITLQVGRELLADAQGAAPFPGRSLEQVSAKAAPALSGVQILSNDFLPTPTPARVGDEMPDAGKEDGRYAVRLGLPQTGSARLSSDIPFRSSNGEATTLVYEVQARNVGKERASYDLVAAKVPPGFTVTLPTPVLELGPGKSKAIPVLVTVPFAHEHGATRSLVVEMRAHDDPSSVGRVELGVRTTFPPQPAGHHDKLFIHASRTDGTPEQFDAVASRPYMNTLDDDPADTGAPIPSSCCLNMNGVAEARHRWYVRLSPGLQMGLDFDTGRAGKYAMHVAGNALPQATLSGTLYVEEMVDDEWESLAVATLAPSGPRDLVGGTPQLFEGEIRATEDADLVPFVPQREMWLVLDLKTLGAASVGGPAAPHLQPGAYLQLPLLEYHDPVAPILLDADVPVLLPQGDAERAVNPGKSVVFPFDVQLPGNLSRVDLAVTGTHAEWATAVPSTLELAAGGVGKASIVVRVPAGTPDGERADLVVRAFDPDQPERQGLARFVAQVDADAELPDEVPVAAAAAQESPGPGALLALVGAVAAAAVAARRRNGRA